MSTGANEDTADIAEEPFLDDAERMESEWLLARMNAVAAPVLPPEIVRAYTNIEAALGELPRNRLDERWREQVLVTARSRVSPPRPWWRRTSTRWALAAAFATAAAAVVLPILFRDPPYLSVAIRRPGEARSREITGAVAGDHLVIKARHSKPGELRIYRANGAMVGRCPNGQGCNSSTEEEFDLDVALDAPGVYHVILIEGAAGTSIGAEMERYIDAARAANVEVIRYGPIDVN